MADSSNPFSYSNPFSSQPQQSPSSTSPTVSLPNSQLGQVLAKNPTFSNPQNLTPAQQSAQQSLYNQVNQNASSVSHSNDASYTSGGSTYNPATKVLQSNPAPSSNLMTPYQGSSLQQDLSKTLPSTPVYSLTPYTSNLPQVNSSSIPNYTPTVTSYTSQMFGGSYVIPTGQGGTSTLSPLADIELGTEQFALSTGKMLAELPLVGLAGIQNYNNSTGLDSIGNKFSFPNIIPNTARETQIYNTPTASGLPIAVIGGLSLVGMGGFNVYSDIKSVVTGTGIIDSLRGINPINFQSSFTPNVEDILGSSTAKSQRIIKGDTSILQTGVSGGQDITGLSGDYLGTTKVYQSNVGISKLTDQGIATFSSTLTNYPTTEYSPSLSGGQFTTTRTTTPSFSLSAMPINSIEDATAFVNGKQYPATFGYQSTVTATKSPSGNLQYTYSKGYGLITGDKTFAYNTGDVGVSSFKIPGTSAKAGEEFLSSKLSGIGRTIDLDQLTGGGGNTGYKSISYTKPDGTVSNLNFGNFNAPPVTSFSQANIPSASFTSAKISPVSFPSTGSLKGFGDLVSQSTTKTTTITPYKGSFLQTDLNKQSPLQGTSVITKTSDIVKNTPKVSVGSFNIPSPKQFTSFGSGMGLGSGSSIPPIPKQLQGYSTPPPSPTPTFTIPDPPPNFSVPNIPVGGTFDFGSTARSFRGKQRKKYTPSFESLVFNIRGKQPKNLTGVTNRPIPKGYSFAYNKPSFSFGSFNLPKFKIPSYKKMKGGRR